MKQFLVFIITLGIVLGLITAAYRFAPMAQNYIKSDSTIPPPQSNVERITSFFLERQIEELRSRVVFLQHKIEGERIAEMLAL